MGTYETLSPYEQWMVRSNLETIGSTGVTPAEQAALLRANGYARIAGAVEEVAAIDATFCPHSLVPRSECVGCKEER